MAWYNRPEGFTPKSFDTYWDTIAPGEDFTPLWEDIDAYIHQNELDMIRREHAADVESTADEDHA